MRRIGVIIASTLGAALLAAGTTASAQAPRHTAPDPAPAAPSSHTAPAERCVNATVFPFVVRNTTPEPALVFDQPDCAGDVIGVVPPGQTQTFEFGASALFAS
ncbi:hypothetical protein [Embleya hyalina]|uniref:Uncharacterized protein n=1 Tax=Embleya hyalina TaxID=516124 RepID=A0A401YZ60_9ACTN|nr:hypothetical protein [Embleya hyalina]GCD99785.1 hypothetical protein EHYA_07507 [Embleya hyalina]